jgi:hypothetical protein
MQQHQFPLPSYKGTRGPGTTSRHAGVPPQEALHRVHRRRGGRPVQREGPAGFGMYLRMHQRIGRGAQQDRSGGGLLLEPCRRVERRTDCRGQPLRVLPETTNDH